MLQSKLKASYDWVILGIYLSLLCIGWMTYYAISYPQNADQDILSLSTPITKQSLYILIALGVLLFTLLIGWKLWQTFAYAVYGVGIFLLVLVLIIGAEIKGAKAWFSFGAFSFQPAEIAKLGTALAMASFLSNFKTDLKIRQYQLIGVGIVLLPVFLILLQPDAGSAITFFTFFILMFIVGLNEVYYLIGLLLFITFILGFLVPFDAFVFGVICIAIIASWYFSKRFQFHLIVLFLAIASVIVSAIFLNHLYAFGVGGFILSLYLSQLWRSRQERMSIMLVGGIFLLIGFSLFSNSLFQGLEPHQQERIKVWLKPEECDPRGSLYNILQSKVAIGSGGFWGKGFLQGNMTKLKFVPEQSTDFIFSTIGEEHGFVGSLTVIVLYFVLIFKILRSAESHPNKFISYYSIAFAGLLFIHVLINIGMTIGLVPIIGIPLPFISKGGSSLIGMSLMLGIYLRMHSRT